MPIVTLHWGLHVSIEVVTVRACEVSDVTTRESIGVTVGAVATEQFSETIRLEIDR